MSIATTNRHGVRAPRGGITIRGRYFRGGCFCWNAPADPVPTPKLGVTSPAISPMGERPAPAQITIAGFAYSVRPLAIHPEVGSVAFALDRKDTGHSYTIHRDIHGEVCCTCPDYTLRRAGSGKPCKHGKALVDLGLIPAIAPRVLPTFANRVDHVGRASNMIPARRRRFEPSAEDKAAAAELLAWRS